MIMGVSSNIFQHGIFVVSLLTSLFSHGLTQPEGPCQIHDLAPRLPRLPLPELTDKYTCLQNALLTQVFCNSNRIGHHTCVSQIVTCKLDLHHPHSEGENHL